MILNVVPPYVYRLEEDTLVFGEIPNFSERDGKVSNLVRMFLDSGNKVQLFQEDNGNGMRIFSEMAIKTDSILGILGDSRIKVVETDLQGVPYSENEFDFEGDNYFIGGQLDRCLANTMGSFGI